MSKLPDVELPVDKRIVGNRLPTSLGQGVDQQAVAAAVIQVPDVVSPIPEHGDQMSRIGARSGFDVVRVNGDVVVVVDGTLELLQIPACKFRGKTETTGVAKGVIYRNACQGEKFPFGLLT